MTEGHPNGHVLLASPGMEDMAKNLLWLINAHAQKENTPLFDSAGMSLKGFANGEHEPKLLETVRGAHVFLLHPMQLPDPNAALVNLHLIKDALMSAAVGKITLVLPYLSFMRQDRRKDNERVPISARAVARLIQQGVEQIITLDLHSDQEVGFFKIPVDNIPGSVVCMGDLLERHGQNLSNVIAVAPDVGSATRVRRISRKLDVPLAIIDKDRKGPGQAEVLGILGQSVKGMQAVLFDDMIDTGGTIINAANYVLEEGAESVEIYAIHGLFCGNALENFARSNIQVRVTNTIPRSPVFRAYHESWLTYVSIEQLLAEAIHQASRPRGSISKLSA